MVIQSLSHVWFFSTPCTAAHQVSLSTISWRFAQTHVHWVSDTIQPSRPLSSPTPPVFSLSASGSFPVSQLFSSGGQSIGTSASTSVPAINIQDWSPLGWTGWSPCSPRDSQESSPTLQFENINSLLFSLLYGPTLTSVSYKQQQRRSGRKIGEMSHPKSQ